MHQTSYDFMQQAIAKYLDRKAPLRILDVGSSNVNGCYAPLFKVPGWTYTGLDIAPSSNVDIVVDKLGIWDQIPDGAYDVVVSGQCLEHCEQPWVIVKAMERVCKPGGTVIIIAPWSWAIHRHPVDCWRILPDGMSALMTKYCSFRQLLCDNNATDTRFVGIKL